MKTQKQLKEIFKEEIKKAWKDEKMQKYCIKESCYLIEFEDGSLLSFDKPRIKKDFCFGYSDSAYDTDDYDRAQTMADFAKENEKHFITENLKEINKNIENLKSNKFDFTYTPHYYSQEDDCKLICINTFYKLDQNKKGIDLTNEQINQMIEAYEEIKKAFIKQLNTYLKKYGLEKVRTWSYWRDM